MTGSIIFVATAESEPKPSWSFALAIVAAVLLFVSGGSYTALGKKNSYSATHIVIPWREQVTVQTEPVNVATNGEINNAGNLQQDEGSP